MTSKDGVKQKTNKLQKHAGVYGLLTTTSETMQSFWLPCFEAVFTCLICKLNLKLMITYRASDTARFTCLGDLKAKKPVTCLQIYSNVKQCTCLSEEKEHMTASVSR